MYFGNFKFLSLIRLFESKSGNLDDSQSQNGVNKAQNEITHFWALK